MHIQQLLKNFGLSDKETAVYLALIELGPSPVRLIARKSEVNRGTTYDILKSLREEGLVSYFDKDSHQYFAAEPPYKLVNALERRQQQLESVKEEISGNLAELNAVFQRQGGRPAVKYYEGESGLRQILEDVLATVALVDDKRYFVYSSASVRRNVHSAMPDFNKQRLAKKICVQTIALGDGGDLAGLDERKWLPGGQGGGRPTYEIVYGGKVAHIGLDEAGIPIGVVIDNSDIYETQKMIFEFTWSAL